MRKLFVLLCIVLVSCEDAGIRNPGGDKEFIIQVDSTRYKIKNVLFGKGSGNIYIMVPESSKVSIPQSILFTGPEDDTKTIIKVNK